MALGLLCQQYTDLVLHVVRRMMRTELRRRYDSHDFVQSVWASFARLPLSDHTFSSPEDLVAYLARMAYNKVCETTREDFSQKRDMRRECSLDAAAPDNYPLSEQVPGRTPSPSQNVIAHEKWQQIVAGQMPGHIRVLELLRDGHTPVEITRNHGVHPKIIQRLLNRLRHYLDRQ